jgi:predicted enzyme related to lactoylglutathione lyase
MQTKLLNAVVLAENYEAIVEWYRNVFELEIISEINEDYRYTELGAAGKLVVGIALAEEMKLKPTSPRNNAVIVQVAVSDIHICFKRVEDTGGETLFGPSVEGELVYGGIADPEGNQVWVVEG